MVFLALLRRSTTKMVAMSPATTSAKMITRMASRFWPSNVYSAKSVLGASSTVPSELTTWRSK